MIKINTQEDEMWDRVIDYYFDHVWPGGRASIIDWVEEEYNCKMIDNVAHFRDEAAATLFCLRWA